MTANPDRAAAPPKLRCVNLSKKFGPTTVLDRVSFSVAPGTIHALVGENGAGKSTLLGILSGRISGSSGSVEIEGNLLRQGRTRESHDVGVRTIYQELMTIPALSAERNVFLGHPASRAGFLRRRVTRRAYEDLCARLGVPARTGVLARDLSVAELQMIEIMRALAADAQVILYDEPTAALAEHERDALFAMMRRQRIEGRTQVLVSHNIDDVIDICDAVTVLRNGRAVAHFNRSQLVKDEIVTAMLGAALGTTPPRDDRRNRTDTPALRIRHASIPERLHDVSFDVSPGEIVGVAGLVGSGRSSLLRAIAGLEATADGGIEVGGRPYRWPHSPRRAQAMHLALIPEDRKQEGLVMSLTAAENVALADLGQVARFGLVSRRRLRQVARVQGARVGFDPQRAETPAGELSGGNQQKLLLARWLHKLPQVLLADEPVRGVDVGAKDEILRTICALAEQGVAIILVSSELEAVLPVCHRVLVLAQGRIVKMLNNQPPHLAAADVLASVFVNELRAVGLDSPELPDPPQQASEYFAT